MKVALLEEKCETCGATHAKPDLGDFAYGQFIFTSETGETYAYVEAPSVIWSILESALPPSKNPRQSADLLLRACAHFADSMNGQRLVNHFVCPKCRSSKAEYWGGEKRGEADVPLATFDAFMGLPSHEQQNSAKNFYASVKS